MTYNNYTPISKREHTNDNNKVIDPETLSW